MTIVVGPAVIKQAKALGIAAPIAQTVKDMAKFSAPYTGRIANRRYEDYVMQVVDGKVLSIEKFKDNDYPTHTFEKILCPDCANDGDYCLTCNTTGYITVY